MRNDGRGLLQLYIASGERNKMKLNGRSEPVAGNSVQSCDARISRVPFSPGNRRGGAPCRKESAERKEACPD